MLKISRIFLIIILSVFIVTVIHLFIFKKPLAQIFCQKKANAMILNFKLSVNFTSQSEEERYVNSLVKKLYDQCLQHNN